MIFQKVRQELTVCDKVLLKRNLLVLPKSLRNRALNIAHQGHLSLSKTKSLIREKTWFPNIDKLTEELINSCLPCQLVGLPKPPAPLQSTQLPPKPWHTVNMDFLGPLPSGEMLLVVIDQYSRFPEVEILRSTAASATIPKLDSIFARHGYPVKVRTDNGPPCTNAKERTFNIGDTVLVKQQKKSKLSTRFNPNIYTVKHVKGTMITATSGMHSITRNVSFFKHFNGKEHKNTTDFSDDEDDYKVKLDCDQVIINRRYPLRNRELPQRYVDPSSCIITHG